MAFRDINTGLTVQRFTLMKSLLDQLESELRFVIKLTAAERRTLNPIRDRRYPFVDKCFEYAQDFPHLMPAIRSVQNFSRIKFDNQSLDYIARRLASLTEKVKDTDQQVSSNCYDYSLVFYDMITYAAQSDQPGTQAVKDDLSTLFLRTSGNDDEILPSPDGGSGNSGGGNSGGGTISGSLDGPSSNGGDSQDGDPDTGTPPV